LVHPLTLFAYLSEDRWSGYIIDTILKT